MAAELSPCSDKPNCVSSLEAGRDSYIAPLRYAGEMADAREKLLALIKQQVRTHVLRDEGAYVKASFTSRVFGFVDDVEFLFDDQARLIHVRSASRKGHYDFGVNRRRVERLHSGFEK